jgi:hypothetical protein
MKNEFNHARLIPNGDGITGDETYKPNNDGSTKETLIAAEGTGSTVTQGPGI